MPRQANPPRRGVEGGRDLRESSYENLPKINGDEYSGPDEKTVRRALLEDEKIPQQLRGARAELDELSKEESGEESTLAIENLLKSLYVGRDGKEKRGDERARAVETESKIRGFIDKYRKHDYPRELTTGRPYELLMDSTSYDFMNNIEAILDKEKEDKEKNDAI